jgi:FG-GAP repeat
MRPIIVLSLIAPAVSLAAISSAVHATSPLFKLAAPADISTGNAFGFDVATDGTTIVVGSRIFGAPGAAYLYDAHTGAPIAKLIHAGALVDQFGTTVAVQGKKAVVGSWQGAFIYDFSDGSHIVETPLVPTGGLVNMFGVSVDISGNTVIVGANDENRLGDFTGAAYLFDASTGAQLAKLTANDAQSGDNFGIDVAIDGTVALVGSPLSKPGGILKGAVYQFDASPGVTLGQQQAKYVVPNPTAANPTFGYSLDIFGNRIVAEEAYGETHLWSLGGTPAPLPMSQGQHAVGDSAAIDDQRIAVGFYGRESVAMYSPNGEFRGSITSGSPMANEGFGTSVALANQLLVVGATGTDGKGAAFVYVVPEPAAANLVIVAIVLYTMWWRKKGISVSNYTQQHRRPSADTALVSIPIVAARLNAVAESRRVQPLPSEPTRATPVLGPRSC